MISKFFINRPRFAMVISIVLMLAGAISLRQLPIAEYPEIAPPEVYVYTVYPGASAQVVADTVAAPLEAEINGVEDLLYFSSTSDNAGLYACIVTFRSGTSSDMAMVNLQNAVKRAEAKLPDEVVRSGINVEKRNSDMLGVYVFTTNGGMPVLELNNYVNRTVKDAVARVEGVAAVEVLSDQEYSMRIWLNPFRVSGLGISTDEIVAAATALNELLPNSRKIGVDMTIIKRLRRYLLAGFLIMVPAEELRHSSLTVEQALRMVVSLGMTK